MKPATLGIALLHAASSALLLAATLTAAATPPCALPPPNAPLNHAATEQIAQTPAGPIAYYRFGHGTPILLVTGFRATMAEWNALFLDTLARHHTLILFDNRGIGRSLPNAKSFTVADMAHDTAALIATLKLSHPTLLGWSMGGAIVQRLATDDPHVPGRIVLLSTLAPGAATYAVPPDTEAKLSGRPGVTFADIMRVLFPPTAAPQAERCFVTEMAHLPGYTEPSIPPAVTAGQSALLHAWANDKQEAAALREISTPTLILTGTEDTVVSPVNATKLHNLLPNSHLVEMPGGGHAMMYQFPRALAEDIDDFTN